MKFLIVFLSALFLSTAALADDVVYKTNLGGAAQVPPVQTTVTGEFIYTTFDNRWYLVALGAARDDMIVAAHIHCGSRTANGPIIYPFYAGPPRRNVLVKDVFDASKFVAYTPTADCPIQINTIVGLRAAIRSGLIYVNVHTQQHPGGIVRGQVFRLI
jgi:hypothetical protein